MKEDSQIKKWLAEHADQLSPEELISEAEKQRLFDGSWPEPQEIEDLGVFANIKDGDSFNDIVSNPENWSIILNRSNLFEKWILPHAVLYFGKLWFDRVKRQNSISRGVPFPLFSEDEKQRNIETTPQGRAKIAKIVEKISVVLKTYLEGKWYDGTTRKPSGYIIDSLRNEFVREIGLDMGYKFRNALACPYCLISNPPSRVVLESYPNRLYSCPKCKEIVENLKLKINSLKNKAELDQIIKMKNIREKFKEFIGITCICPSDRCPGYFVPLSCVDQSMVKQNIRGALKDIVISKNVRMFSRPPDPLLDFHLTCPYCGTNFTPKEALRQKSGFKGKSGFLTGLPSIRIWVKREEITLDETHISQKGTLIESLKDRLAADPSGSENKIAIKQRLNLIIDEIIFHMSRVNKNTISGLSTWYFLMSVIAWILKYSSDADNYFFGWKVNMNTRGKEASVHQAIFHEWMDILEQNIDEFKQLDPRIRNLKDFKWFARSPKFTGGPETEFYSEVDEGNRIINKTPIRKRKSKKVPRLARVYSVRKDGVEFIQDVEMVEWQAIKLKSTSLLKPKDKVLVEAIVMSSHPTHAPIQRMLRLRSILLENIVSKIVQEEKTGQSDKLFWKNWRNKVANAKKRTGICISL